MTGDVEAGDDDVLVVKRIHVHYHLEAEPGTDRATVERVHDFHADYCPVARSVRDAITVSTELTIHERGTRG